MPYLDFAAIKQQIKIADAARALQLNMTAKGSQMRGPCPACKAGGDRALAVNTDKQSFYCFPARQGGT